MPVARSEATPGPDGAGWVGVGAAPGLFRACSEGVEAKKSANLEKMLERD